MDIQFETFESPSNPLDSVEEILSANNWAFSRTNNDELVVQITGKACDYRLFFIWQQDLSALQFCCQYDLTVHPSNLGVAAQALMNINENVWLGHFDIPRGTLTPSFRQTCLMRGMTGPSCIEHIEDLVDVSMAQCERYFGAFHILSIPRAANDENMTLALMDTAGES